MKRKPILSRQYRRLLREAVDRKELTTGQARQFRQRVTKMYYEQPNYAYYEFDPPWTNHKCCPLALSNPCVCTESWFCPSHGMRHYGTHD